MSISASAATSTSVGRLLVRMSRRDMVSSSRFIISASAPLRLVGRMAFLFGCQLTGQLRMHRERSVGRTLLPDTEVDSAIGHRSLAVLAAIRPDQHAVAHLGDPPKGSGTLGCQILHTELQAAPVALQRACE